ncbi:MAG TPA: phosphatidate cytidylyltransferase [Candidatus Krumholzibacteria bacterium]|nr:phosphatidate cytidylyltransferase [Candidatus Krumholzibacteria bacterium]
MSESETRPILESAPATLVKRGIVRRVFAAAVFLPLFVLVTKSGGYYFLGFVDLFIVLGLSEFYRMMSVKGMHPYRGVGIVSGLTLSTYMYFRSGMYASFILTFVLIAIMGLELTRKDNRRAVYHVATTVFGIVYVAYLGSHLVLLRELPLQIERPYELGARFVFLAFTVTWASDTGAYIIGSMFGKKPLLPRVSRSKTWEGAVGGVVFSALAGYLSSLTFASFLPSLWAVALGAMCSVIGLLGDLFESMLKRDAEIKDTSQIIPGHGGVLDRFDSLLFTVPLIYYFLKFVIFK